MNLNNNAERNAQAKIVVLTLTGILPVSGTGRRGKKLQSTKGFRLVPGQGLERTKKSPYCKRYDLLKELRSGRLARRLANRD